MMKLAFILMIALRILSGEVMAREQVDEIDLEVVSLLNLDGEQAVAYSAIMQRQRALYRTLQPTGWTQQRAFYRDTFDKLKPVLSEEQHLRFVGYMDSFLEAIPADDLLVME